MRIFIWVMAVLSAASMAATLSDLAKGEWSKTSPGVKAWNVFINAMIVAWALALLL